MLLKVGSFNALGFYAFTCFLMNFIYYFLIFNKVPLCGTNTILSFLFLFFGVFLIHIIFVNKR